MCPTDPAIKGSPRLPPTLLFGGTRWGRKKLLVEPLLWVQAAAMGSITSAPAVWPALRCEDARGLIKFLVAAFGFAEALVVPGDKDIVVHAELKWPLGGGVMVGSDRGAEDELRARMPKGPVSIYVVTDEPDAVVKSATTAGAEVIRGHYRRRTEAFELCRQLVSPTWAIDRAIGPTEGQDLWP
jgi:uncharacterized glyoxalase superfamily protein PhnB